MAYRVTPWADEKEWITIKHYFYPRPEDSKDNRQSAVDRVNAWEIRGRVPHSVTSTALLTTALLRDQAGSMTMLEARMLIAMALCRFVNGLIDPAQQSVYAISMVTLARNINLPESFVDIRHSATHDALPSLPVLRDALLRALDWLWHAYWNVTADDVRLKRDVEDEASITRQMKSLIKQWRIHRLERMTLDDPTLLDSIDEKSSILLKDIRKIKGGPVATAVLTRFLLTDKCLLNKTQPMRRLWNPFLQACFEHQHELRMSLVSHAIELLSSEDVVKQSMVALQGYDNLVSDTSDKRQRSECIGNLILWLLEASMPGSVNTSQILRSLSLLHDDMSMHVMQELQAIDGFDDAGRCIALRNALESGNLQSIPPELLVKPERHGEDLIICKTTGGRFTRVKYAKAMATGHYIQ